MEETPPDWLSADFLTKCLQHEEEYRDVVVTNYSTVRAALPGEHYLSCPLRVKVDYSDTNGNAHSLSLIIKSEITNSNLQNIADTFGCSESIFYRNFLPEVSSFEVISFAPKSFFSPKFSIVVLEDLREDGYVMASRVKGLDFEHCRCCLSNLAALHAVSFAVIKEKPEFIESIGKDKLYFHGSMGESLIKMMIVSAMRCMTEYSEVTDRFKKYSKLLENISSTVWDMVVEVVKRREEFNTITHVDPSINNMMFKYNEQGTLVEMKLLDFQAVRYGSPALDLVYFTWTSMNEDVRLNRRDELYQYYVKELNRNLKQMNCSESISYDDINQKIKSLSPLALSTMAIYQHLLCEKPLENVDDFFVKGNEEKCYQLYKPYFDENARNNRLSKQFEALELAGVFEYFNHSQE
uniref:CHK kinase-like domain-containing protein n=1 Tax=Cuerna arida TaxID=1464854 RepID=A0A1B6G4N1_9HEMI